MVATFFSFREAHRLVTNDLNGSAPPPERTHRRSVLKAGLAALALGRLPLTRASEPSDVIVLGAGLAGLNSALHLHDLGYRVLLLEASDRVGGRVLSRKVDGVLHEMGASDIDVLYARVINTAARFNLALKPTALRFHPFSYHIGGELLHANEWRGARVNSTEGRERAIEPARLESSLVGELNPLAKPSDWRRPVHAALDVSLGSFLRSQGISQAAIDLIAHTYNSEDIEGVSALSVFHDQSRMALAMEVWKERRENDGNLPAIMQIEGGMQRLPQAMAEEIGDGVRTARPAALVEQDDTGVTVTCRDGSRYGAERLVCAMSLPAMRNVDFSPPLSADKRFAIREGDYYATTKFYLRPTAPYWKEDGYAPGMWSDGLIERIFLRDDDDGNVRSLLVWINGAGARRIDKLNSKEGGERVLEELARIRPASEGHVEVVHHQSWGSDRLFGGCGFKYPAGQVERLVDELPRAEGRIHFAGEHTRQLEVGMEAAMASGERAAVEVAMAG